MNHDIARWLGHHLADMAPFPTPRLLGLTVLDDEAVIARRPGGLRFISVAEGDPYELLDGPAVLVADRYDALALVAAGRAFPPDGMPVMVISVMSIDHDPAFYVLGTAIDPPSFGDGTANRGRSSLLPEGINDEEPTGGIPLAVRDWRRRALLAPPAAA